MGRSQIGAFWVLHVFSSVLRWLFKVHSAKGWEERMAKEGREAAAGGGQQHEASRGGMSSPMGGGVQFVQLRHWGWRSVVSLWFPVSEIVPPAGIESLRLPKPHPVWDFRIFSRTLRRIFCSISEWRCLERRNFRDTAFAWLVWVCWA